MKISVNQLRLELADIEQSHIQLNTFFWGDFPRAVNEENINYPLMASYFPNAGFLDNQTTLPITIVIADKIYDDYTNLNDVESDTLQICRDVFNIMNKSTRWQLLGRVESCSLTKFIESNADVCAGYVMTVNFTLRDSNSICDLPMSGYDFDQVIGSSCLPVQIYRNGVLVDTVASGGTYSYTTDAFTYTIKNTDNTTLYSGNVTANLNVTIQDCTVSNSDASYSATVTAEGNLDLPDITVDVINSLDVVVSTQISASVQDVTISAPDGTIENSDATFTASIPSGTNYTLTDEIVEIYDENNTLIDTVTFPTLGDAEILLSSYCPTPSPRSTATLLKSGQQTSFRTGDDGDLEAGRATSFLVLDTAPLHNNGSATLNTTTNRFTDELGSQTYTNNIVLDWSTWNGSTLLGYRRTLSATAVAWNNAIDDCLILNIGGFAIWRLPNISEMINLNNYGKLPLLNYSPININLSGSDNLWSSTTVEANGTLAYYVSYLGFAFASKASAYKYIPVRTFSLSTSNVLS